MYTKISYVKHFNIISKIKREVTTCEQKLGSIALNGSSKLSEKSLIKILTFFKMFYEIAFYFSTN